MPVQTYLVARSPNVIRYQVTWRRGNGTSAYINVKQMQRDLDFKGSALDQLLERAASAAGSREWHKLLLGVGMPYTTSDGSVDYVMDPIGPGHRHVICSVLPIGAESTLLDVSVVQDNDGSPMYAFEANGTKMRLEETATPPDAGCDRTTYSYRLVTNDTNVWDEGTWIVEFRAEHSIVQ